MMNKARLKGSHSHPLHNDRDPKMLTGKFPLKSRVAGPEPGLVSPAPKPGMGRRAPNPSVLLPALHITLVSIDARAHIGPKDPRAWGRWGLLGDRTLLTAGLAPWWHPDAVPRRGERLQPCPQHPSMRRAKDVANSKGKPWMSTRNTHSILTKTFGEENDNT